MLSFLSLLLVLEGRPDDSLYHHVLIDIANNFSPIHIIKVDKTSDSLSTLPKQSTSRMLNLNRNSRNMFTTLFHIKGKNPMKITPPDASTSK